MLSTDRATPEFGQRLPDPPAADHPSLRFPLPGTVKRPCRRRTGVSRLRPGMLIAILVLLVAFGAAGCAGDSLGDATSSDATAKVPAAASAPRSTATSRPTATLTPLPTLPLPTATPPPLTATPAPSPVLDLTRSCRVEDLEAAATWQDATGAQAGALSIRNVAKTACALPRLPRIELDNAKGAKLKVDVAASLGEPSSNQATVTIQSQGRANATLVWRNWCAVPLGAVQVVVSLSGNPRALVVSPVGPSGAPLVDAPRCDEKSAPSTLTVGGLPIDRARRLTAVVSRADEPGCLGAARSLVHGRRATSASRRLHGADWASQVASAAVHLASTTPKSTTPIIHTRG